VIQAETGGGFGGKEEYPSMIALHAALLAQRLGRPVRMIYDRHEDIAATTKRHPAIVRHRTGVTSDGRMIAQEIDVVMGEGRKRVVRRLLAAVDSGVVDLCRTAVGPILLGDLAEGASRNLDQPEVDLLNDAVRPPAG